MGSDYCQIAAKLCNGKFNNRDSPRDKTQYVKGDYLLPLIEG